MTDWTSPSQIELDIKIYKAYIFRLLGVIFWELVTTLGYDISVLFGLIPWRWPMVAYFVSRYFTLIFNLTAIVFVQRTTDPSLNCDLLVKLIFVFGEVALWMASSIFILRAIALSGWRKKTGIFLVGIWIIQGALCLWSAFTVDAEYTEGVGCHVTHTSDAFSAGFWMALVVDAAAFIIIVRQLRKAHAGVPFAKLARVLIKDGLIYVSVAVTFHLLSVILIQLKLNAILQIFPAPMATVFPSILACRAFRELSLQINEAKTRDNALPTSKAKREERKKKTAKAKFWHGWENANSPSVGTGSHTQETSAKNHSRQLQMNGVSVTETRAHSTSFGPRNDDDNLELNTVLASPTSPGFLARRGLKPWDSEKADYFNSSNPGSPVPTPLTPTFSFNRVRRERTTSNNSIPFSGPGFTIVSGSEVSPNGELMSPSTMIGDYSPQKSEFGADATRGDDSSELDRPEQINTNFVDDEIPNSEIPSPHNQSSACLQQNQSPNVETSRAFHIDMGQGYRRY